MSHLAGSLCKRLPAGQKLGGLKEVTWSGIVSIRAQLSGEASQVPCKRAGIMTSVKQQARVACRPQPTVVCDDRYLIK